MHILLGIGAAVALLYFWLMGHWFARVLAFLVFAGTFGICGALLTSSGADYGGAGIPGLVIGIIAAWPVSAIPSYLRQRQVDRINGISMTRDYWSG